MFSLEVGFKYEPVTTFAIADKEAGKGRVHIGILGPYGKDQTMYTQTSASLLQRSHDIRNADAAQDELIDPY